MTRLADLDGHLIRLTDYFDPITSLADAAGVAFLCPACFAANGGPVGTHMVLCWFAGRGVPDDLHPGPGRWEPSGTCLDDLTFIGPNAASVDVGCWHGFVRNGDAA